MSVVLSPRLSVAPLTVALAPLSSLLLPSDPFFPLSDAVSPTESLTSDSVLPRPSVAPWTAELVVPLAFDVVSPTDSLIPAAFPPTSSDVLVAVDPEVPGMAAPAPLTVSPSPVTTPPTVLPRPPPTAPT